MFICLVDVCIDWRHNEGLAQKVVWRKRQANTGSAGALARSEREARNSYRVRKFEIESAEQACAGEGARAPSIDLLRHSDDFLGKASKTGYLTAVCLLSYASPPARS